MNAVKNSGIITPAGIAFFRCHPGLNPYRDQAHISCSMSASSFIATSFLAKIFVEIIIKAKRMPIANLAKFNSINGIKPMTIAKTIIAIVMCIISCFLI